MRLPGHHGLEWLAILMAARLASQRPGAALAVALGAAATALASAGGGETGLRPLTYLVQGLVLDGLYLLLRGRVGGLWMAIPLGALVHALSPLIKTLLASGGSHWLQSLTQGLGFPLMTHALFGAVGAATGALLVLGWRKRSPR